MLNEFSGNYIDWNANDVIIDKERNNEDNY